MRWLRRFFHNHTFTRPLSEVVEKGPIGSWSIGNMVLRFPDGYIRGEVVLACPCGETRTYIIMGPRERVLIPVGVAP